MKCKTCNDTGIIRTPSDRLMAIEEQGGHGIEEPRVCECQRDGGVQVRPTLDEIMKYIIDNNYPYFGHLLHFLTKDGKDDMIEAIHYYRNGAPNLNLPELEVSYRKSCDMCLGKGGVILTPGKGTPHIVTCDWCGGCGKMGADPPEQVIERWSAIKKWLGGT